MHGDIPERPSLSASDDVRSKQSDRSLVGNGTRWEPNKSEVNHVAQCPQRLDASPVTSTSVKMMSLNYKHSTSSASTSAIYPLSSSVFPSYSEGVTGRMNRRKALYAEPRGIAQSWEITAVTSLSDNAPLDKCYIGGKGFSRFLKNQMRWRDLSVDTSNLIASTTPSAPFSQDLIASYSTGPDPLRTEELRIGNHTDREVARWKSSNQQQQQALRPPSQGKEHRHSKGSVDKESGGGVPGDKRGPSPLLLNNGKLLNTSTSSSNSNTVHNNNNNTGAGAIGNQFKALGMRNNFLSGQQIPTSSSSLPQTTTQQQPQSTGRLQPPTHAHSVQHRADELIAMGTNWNPPPSSNNTSSGSGASNLRNGRPHHPATSSASNLLMPVGGATAGRNSKSVISRTTMGGGASRHMSKSEEAPPRYSDPLPGAPLTFQQRLAELSSLEQETIRYEKSRKFKKKPKDTS